MPTIRKIKINTEIPCRKSNMAQPTAEQPLQHLTLNKWFSYRDGVFSSS